MEPEKMLDMQEPVGGAESKKVLNMSAISKALAKFTGSEEEEGETFTCFPRLPIELRIKIFYRALPGPRTIEVVSGHNGFLVKHPPPTLLAVSKESREEALKKYNFNIGVIAGVAISYCWVAPVDDTLLFIYSGRTLGSYTIHAPDPELPSNYQPIGDRWYDVIQNIAIDVDTMYRHKEIENFRHFKALKQLTFILHHVSGGCDDSWDKEDWQIDFVDPTYDLLKDQTTKAKRVIREVKEQTIKEEYPEWSMPAMKCVAMTRGGKRCCKCDKNGVRLW